MTPRGWRRLGLGSFAVVCGLGTGAGWSAFEVQPPHSGEAYACLIFAVCCGAACATLFYHFIEE